MLMKKTAFFPSLVVFCLTIPLSIGVVSAGSISKSTTDILHFQERLAEKGNVQAQYKLASMYEFGIGTEKDLSVASDWYRRAASNGSIEAENRLVYLEIRMNGFNEKSHTDWLNKIRRGAETGDQHSAMLLGQMFSYGLGVDKNLNQSLQLLNKAGVYENPVVVYEIERVEKERSQLAKERSQQQEEMKQQQQEEAKKISQPAPEAINKAEIAAKQKVDEMAEKRRRYEEVMRKIKEEERIIKEQQDWAEGKRAKP